ncbi:MAG: hypothetical protein AAGA23_02715 [Pseudomonadota bacterium]
MTACRRWEGILSEVVLGDAEPQDEARFLAHAKSCAGCTQELTAQRQFQAQLTLPAPSQAGELNAWPAVSRRLAEPRPARGLSLSFGLAGTLATALLVGGIGLGSMLASNGPAEVTPGLVAAAPPEDPYLAFLEQSAPLLLAVTNREVPELVSVSFAGGAALEAEQRAAERLAEMARLLLNELEESGRDREAQLVGELELVFLQVANLSQRKDPGSLRMLKAAIDNRGLLFQLTLEELRNLPPSPNDGA